ncbi:RHS repeat-associated core domain-containing protein [Pleionea mediterranea]|uniref:RHS repeat-associated protein n=1 Tax=Pleionea mediterranea TaxID=523701 RepID=A0A316G1A7_9GAMM|nr:RHS repeat-associated core domain-containing protein [Pleionea mediterranea]PWK54403.1 RHS repeat-associated protein [Pleionea mediterranea]
MKYLFNTFLLCLASIGFSEDSVDYIAPEFVENYVVNCTGNREFFEGEVCSQSWSALASAIVASKGHTYTKVHKHPTWNAQCNYDAYTLPTGTFESWKTGNTLIKGHLKVNYECNMNAPYNKQWPDSFNERWESWSYQEERTGYICTSEDYSTEVDSDGDGEVDQCWREPKCNEVWSGQSLLLKTKNEYIERRSSSIDRVHFYGYQSSYELEDKGVCYIDIDRKTCPEEVTEGNPVGCLSGAKYQTTKLFNSKHFSFNTRYDSRSQIKLRAEDSDALDTGVFGKLRGGLGLVTIKRESQADGGFGYSIYKHGFRYDYFYKSEEKGFINAKKSSLNKSADGSIVYTDINKIIWRFNADLELIEKQLKSGRKIKYKHSNDEHGNTVLSEIIASNGSSVLLEYNARGYIDKLTDVAGNDYLFSYDSHDNLIEIIYPDSTPEIISDNPRKKYLFEDTRFPNALTGIIDESGVRYASWSYNVNGQAISSTHPNSNELVEFNFDVIGETLVKEYQSQNKYYYRKYFYEPIAGSNRVVRVDWQDCETCTPYATESFIYNEKGNLIEKTTKSGAVETYVYDVEDRLVESTLLADSPGEMKTVTVWNDNHNKPAQITRGTLEISFEYDANGNILTKTETDLSSSVSRVTSYSYNEKGDLLSVDGPRNDISDITLYTYNDITGNLQSITNPLGQTIQLSEYNDYGRPILITDKNGINTEVEWDFNGNLTSTSVNDAKTKYEYNSVGLLTKSVTPTGDSLTYKYDNARRLTTVTDSEGNSIQYTYDLMGNQLSSEVLDANNNIIKTLSQSFNSMGQLIELTGASNQAQTFDYDVSGNISQQTDGENNSTTSVSDVLGRLEVVTDALNGKTEMEYNNLSQLTSLTDAEKRTTTYKYNAFGEVIERNSPDTGIAKYTYDASGNLKTKADARDVTTTYQYDALNRLTKISYSNSVETIDFVYDDTSNNNPSIGYLTQITNNTSTINYQYNIFGQVSRETHTISGKQYVTQYHYDTKGRATGITYPTGMSLTYGYNSQGQISQVTSSIDGKTAALASNLAYLPFGPMNVLSFGNGLSLFNTYDRDYRLIESQVTGLLKREYQYNGNNNITSIENPLEPISHQTFVYDPVSRLNNANGEYGSFEYDYDLIGNRLLKNSDSYTYNNSSQLVAKTEPLVNEFVEIEPLFFAKFDEHSSGVVYDSGVNGLQGIAYPGVEVGVQGDTSIVSDLAYNFNGRSNSVVEFTDKSSLELPKGTWRVRFKTSDAGWGNRYLVTARGSLGLMLYYNNISVYNGISKKRTNIKVNDNQWHELAIVFDAGVENGSKLFLDGELVYTFSMSSKVQMSNFYIGGSTTINHWNYSGTIDDVAIYDIKLTDEEIKLLYEKASKTKETQFEYDANGNTVRKGDIAFGYNSANRLSSVTNGEITATYFYNGKGERSVKVVNGVETHFIYNNKGQLIAEANGEGVVLKEYIYLNHQPYAQVIGNDVYYYHNSHLGTPDMMTDENQNIVWQASYTPFGKATIEVEVIENNIRFPGQYYDEESGLHYNYFRDYDPETGRYIESDPIGLKAGVNTYGYVSADPINGFDFWGLKRKCKSQPIDSREIILDDIYAEENLNSYYIPLPKPSGVTLDPRFDYNNDLMPRSTLRPPGLSFRPALAVEWFLAKVITWNSVYYHKKALYVHGDLVCKEINGCGDEEIDIEPYSWQSTPWLEKISSELRWIIEIVGV